MWLSYWNDQLCFVRYKQDVNAGLKREAALEQARVQLELEWQERYDAVKAKHYMANEQLIQDLTFARDQVSLLSSKKTGNKMYIFFCCVHQ